MSSSASSISSGVVILEKKLSGGFFAAAGISYEDNVRRARIIGHALRRDDFVVRPRVNLTDKSVGHEAELSKIGECRCVAHDFSPRDRAWR